MIKKLHTQNDQKRKISLSSFIEDSQKLSSLSLICSPFLDHDDMITWHVGGGERTRLSQTFGAKRNSGLRRSGACA